MLRYLALETKRQYHLYILGCLTDGSGLAAPKASLGSRSWIAVVQLVNGMFADSDRCKAVEEAFTSCVLFTEDVAILEEVTVVVLPMRVRFQVKVQERLWASRQFSAEAQTSSTKESLDSDTRAVSPSQKQSLFLHTDIQQYYKAVTCRSVSFNSLEVQVSHCSTVTCVHHPLHRSTSSTSKPHVVHFLIVVPSSGLSTGRPNSCTCLPSPKSSPKFPPPPLRLR